MLFTESMLLFLAMHVCQVIFNMACELSELCFVRRVSRFYCVAVDFV